MLVEPVSVVHPVDEEQGVRATVEDLPQGSLALLDGLAAYVPADVDQ